MQRPDESAENKDSVAKELDIDRKRILPVEDELVTLKRQKKKIMDRNTTPYKRLLIALVNKVMAASRHSGRDFNQKAFRNKVCEYYQAIQTIDGHKARNRKMVPCVRTVAGRFDSEGGSSRSQKPNVGRIVVSFWSWRSVAV